MSIIAAGTTTTTALSSTGNTDGTLQFQVNGTTASVTLNTLGAIGVGSTPNFGTAGQALVSGGSTAAPTWASVTTSPAGSNTQIQYNNGGSFGASSALTWSGSLLSATTSVSGNSNVLSLINSNTAAGGQGVGIFGYSSNGSNSLGSIQFGGAASLGGNLDFSTANGSGSNTLNMRLDSSGNLGIGTTTANISGGGAGTQVLTLSASASARNAVIELKGTRTSADQVSSYIRSFSNSAVTPGVDLQFYRGTADTDGFLTIATSNTERLRIAANGAFGLSGANYGTSGQVLTSGGSGAAPTWTTPATPSAPGLVLISSTDATAATTLASLSAFSSTYDNYMIILQGISPASGNPKLQLRLAVAGSADSGNNYTQASGTNSIGGGSQSAATSIQIVATDMSNTASQSVNLILHIYDVNTTARTKAIQSWASYYGNVDAAYQAVGAVGRYTPASIVSGIQFFFNGSQNFRAQGSMKIYGYKNS
jgi:hypothetical protein